MQSSGHQILGTTSGAPERADAPELAEEGSFIHRTPSNDQSPLVDALAALVRYQLRPPSDEPAAGEAGSLRPAA